jgi:predicted nucleic acid-binding Zn ribbon protein
MRPLHDVSTGVLAGIIRRQPPSAARTAFAWRLAVGPGLARATAVELRDGLLTVTARSSHWAAELERGSATVLGRMQELLGTAEVRAITVRNP